MVTTQVRSWAPAAGKKLPRSARLVSDHTGRHWRRGRRGRYYSSDGRSSCTSAELRAAGTVDEVIAPRDVPAMWPGMVTLAR
jgi:hypothetical protein